MVPACGRKQAAPEPSEVDAKPADTKSDEKPLLRVKPSGIPSINGTWIEAKGILVNISQKDSEFTADCTYEHAGYGTVHWRMTGTISEDGKLSGRLVHTKAPAKWAKTQIRTGVLSADGASIKGRAVFQGREGGHDFEWRRMDRAKDFVGRWLIGEGRGANACYFILTAPNEARRSDNEGATGTWKIVGNEARITWHDDWKDAIRVQKGGFLKVAFEPGVGWDDPPTNTQAATKEDAPALPPRGKR